MKQLVNFNTDENAILSYTPDFQGVVSFKTHYDADCWRSSVPLMYVLGEALFIAQHFSLHKDAQGNVDYFLQPIDNTVSYGYGLRRTAESLVPEGIIFLGGVSRATAPHDAPKYVEKEDSFWHEANPALFKAVRVGVYRAFKLNREYVGWSANPYEDAYPFMSDFNAGMQIKHPAELALELINGGAVKVYGNFASDKHTHPQTHMIKAYRQAAWKAYHPEKPFPKPRGFQADEQAS